MFLAFVFACGGCGSATPATYDGKWSGKEASGMHVASITISKNEFPCAGGVATQYGSGQILEMDVRWENKGDHLDGLMVRDYKRVIATIRLEGNTLSGKVSLPMTVGDASDFDFSGFTKQEKK